MGRKFACVFRKLAAIGGERQFFQRSRAQMPPEVFNQRHDAFAHQRLSAREAELLHTLVNKGTAHPVQLLQREQVALGQKRHVLRHAIDAAEVATIRHRHAQIADMPAKGIDQGGRAHGLNLGAPGGGVK